MNDILTAIKEFEPSYKPSENKIAKYIIENAANATELPINELAKACDTGEASIVRFCRTIELKVFQELKIRVAASLSKQAEKLDGGITDDNDIMDVIQKIANFNKSNR
ncbi:RpiR family transcriptional regulator [Thermoanaerobacterium thermosaccharolyticum]|uniref:RpiR family transcriptional regulator n=1 Tax=Thermoanaerobacterium thermosaccharolyticum TaxID=1517 RepID=A0A223HXJ7_THETR|nr:RpiR family transcriptional regulator [Thermoanaerobacterium thermosaccharolyticum]